MSCTHISISVCFYKHGIAVDLRFAQLFVDSLNQKNAKINLPQVPWDELHNIDDRRFSIVVLRRANLVIKTIQKSAFEVNEKQKSLFNLFVCFRNDDSGFNHSC